MSFYDNNLIIIKKRFPDIYQLLTLAACVEKIYVGEAYDGNAFLALEKDGDIYSLQSTYSPDHEAERYIDQFTDLRSDTTMVLYGFGSGLIVDRMMSFTNCMQRCVVYEPSVDLFKSALEQWDLSNLLSDRRIDIFVGRESISKLKSYLYDLINIRNYKRFHYAVLSKYRELFPQDELTVRENYQWIIEYMEADYNTMVHFAKVLPRNCIQSMRFAPYLKDINELRPFLNKDIPCIIVAAGPSLKKNIQKLKSAKGHGLIICVDVIANYMLEQGILPDLICSVDPLASDHVQLDPRLQEIPIVAIPSFDYRLVNKYDHPNIIYYASDSELQCRLYEKFGYILQRIDGIGSVSICAFEWAISLGFQTIIMAGQDLAISGTAIYGDKDRNSTSDIVEDLVSEKGLYIVEGYHGGQVATLGDYYAYLEWYNERIPRLKDIKVINATEGGAKIVGTIQMSLEDAVSRYCVKDICFQEMYERAPYVIQGNKMPSYYESLKKYRSDLDHLRIQIKNIKHDEISIQGVIDQVQYGDFKELFHQYMVEAEMEYIESPDIDNYLNVLREAIEFICNNWDEMMEDMEYWMKSM